MASGVTTQDKNKHPRNEVTPAVPKVLELIELFLFFEVER
jgi:hypothetical protein